MTAKVELLTPSGGKVILDPTNTAVDRVLTLPAVAGTVFNQGNVVGTVSQSSGVPTGSIIERGSNANGDFVKYADGTMICQGTVSSINLTGAIAVTTVNFPASFSHQPTLSCSSNFATGDVNNFSGVANIGFVHQGNNALNQWRFAKSNTVNGVATDAILLLTAIGRWF